MLKTISGLRLYDKLDGKIIRRGLEGVALRQGSLDGSCGPYALMMALAAAGIMTMDEINALWQRKIHGNANFAKLQRSLGAGVSQGTSHEQLKEMYDAIRNLSGDRAAFDKFKWDSVLPDIDGATNVRRQCCEHIDEHGLPIIVSLDWPMGEGGGGHWVLLVGYARDAEGVESFLVIDPLSEMSRTSLWNAVLSSPLRRGRGAYDFWGENGEVQQCSIGLSLFLSPK